MNRISTVPPTPPPASRTESIPEPNYQSHPPTFVNTKKAHAQQSHFQETIFLKYFTSVSSRDDSHSNRKFSEIHWQRM
uniref:Sucrose nonfermenting 4-like protein n=1 Tax=Rhizophora mucronata TaxID=61149 RepID=A0A2P2L3A8_RHIMU